MPNTLARLIDRLDHDLTVRNAIIKWGSPVPSFGNLSHSRIATVGLNPSPNEFMDISGNELQGRNRRLHTLRSLNLESWGEVDSRHIRMIEDSCREYFRRNPYGRWFRRLDHLLGATGASFFDTHSQACHLDLIPYATQKKWTQLSSEQHSQLLKLAGDSLAYLLEESPIQVLILNGATVVSHFRHAFGVNLEEQEMPSWALPRNNGPKVIGVSYKGYLRTLASIKLPNSILVLGFNHNIQSSFGVTNGIIRSIRNWIARQTKENLL